MMVFGLIEQADRIGKSALVTQRELATQIQQLAQVQAGIQTAIQELAAERVALGTMRPTLAGYAAKAMREAIAVESGDIKTLTKHSLSQPLLDIEQAASHVRQNVRETRWLTISLYVVLGMALGLAAGYLPLRSDVNQLVGYLAAQQPQRPHRSRQARSTGSTSKADGFDARPSGRAWNAYRVPQNHSLGELLQSY